KEIEELALERRGDATIRVRDVATVERTHAEREVVTTLSGAEAVEIAIYREAGSNIVELADEVKRKLFGDENQRKAAEEWKKQGKTSGQQTLEERGKTDFLAFRMRDEARLELLSDQSTFIKAAVDDVKSSAVIGAILAIAVIWVFLRRIASTFIIGVAIPISVVVTFAPMYMMHVTLNIMSLGGLALGVGMLVDNAIVVLESITRCRSEGDSLGRAAMRGVSEVAGAVTSSTLTTVAVFAPIVFVHGIAGQIFGDQAVTVVWSLLISLLVAITFIPMLASRGWLAGEGVASAAAVLRPPLRSDLRWSWSSFVPNVLLLSSRAVLWLVGAITFAALALFKGLGVLLGWILWPFHWAFDFIWGGVERLYPKAIARALAAPWSVIAVAIALSIVAGWRVKHLGLELLPEMHQGEFTLYTTLGVGTPLETTEVVMSRLDARVRALPGVATTALTVGVEKDTLTRDIEGKHTARLTVRLDPAAALAGGEEVLLNRARSIVAEDPAVRSIDVRRPTPFALDAPITVEILGHDLEKMESTAAEVFQRVATIPGIEDVRTTVRPGHPEARVTFDREKTLQYGLDLDLVSKLVRDQVLGNVSTRFDEGEEKIDVRVQGDEVMLASLDQVLDLVVNPGAATPVELRSVASIERVQGPAEIRRIGNTRAILITASGGGLDLGALNREIETRLETMTPPEEVTVQLGGQKRELDEAQSSLRFALWLALFLVYVVMACQFESLVQPLIVLVTVPLAMVGVVFTLELLSVPISVTVFLGVILLAGIVVNNAIVLIDRVNQQRSAGRGLVEALIDAGRTRLRPIMMTTATTVLGLLPLTGWLENVPLLASLSGGEGAEIRAPMAITVIAGISVSTLLTLIVIPAVYYLVYRRSARVAV
ncbi:MAG: efflux RND transporter permease subunit, partial [Planctomycetota bacterium]